MEYDLEKWNDETGNEISIASTTIILERRV